MNTFRYLYNSLGHSRKISSLPVLMFGASYYLYNKELNRNKFGLNIGECRANLRAHFVTAHTLNPKYDKRWKGGEDALYVSPNNRFVCVMDGVGGWIEILVDSGEMTKEMVHRIRHEYEERYSKGELQTLN